MPEGGVRTSQRQLGGSKTCSEAVAEAGEDVVADERPAVVARGRATVSSELLVEVASVHLGGQVVVAHLGRFLFVY